MLPDAAAREAAQPSWPRPRRLAPLWFLALVIALNVPGPPWEWSHAAADLARQIVAATEGWLSPSLLAAWIRIAFLLVLVCLLGRHPLADLGLRRAGAATGAIVLAASLALGLALLAATGAGYDAAGVARHLVTHIAGVALVEEVFYRGYLLPQLWLHLARRLERPRAALLAAITVHALIFALMHPIAPNAWDAFTGLAEHVIVGAALAWLYARRGQLWILVALHGTNNAVLSLAPDDLTRFAIDATFLAMMLALAASSRRPPSSQ